MDFRDVTKSALAEYREALDSTLDGLTSVELRWQPSPTSNHILWLAWHIARVEDSWLNSYVGGNEHVWVRDRWCQRLHLPAEGGGYGYTAEEVAAFPDITLSDVIGYFDAVRTDSLKVIDGLAESDLATTYPERRPTEPTVAWVLGHVAVEESQHVGQIAYLRGMLRGLNG